MSARNVTFSNSSGLTWLLRGVDLIVPTLIGVAITLYWLGEVPDSYFKAAALGSASFVVIGTISGLYHEWQGRSVLASTYRVVVGLVYQLVRPTGTGVSA